MPPPTGVVNGLIDAGRFLVVNGIKLAVQPILNEVAKAAAALAVVATITSLLRRPTPSEERGATVR